MDVGEITLGMRLGRGSLMAKLDVQMHTTLYQSIQRIAGCRVLNEVLPFMSIWSCPSAVRSAPYIFTCIADLVEWVAKQNYDVTFLMHYLDDFHTLGPPGSSVCQHNLDRSIDCFSKLGIPLHPDKLEGPSTCLTILGIELS